MAKNNKKNNYLNLRYRTKNNNKIKIILIINSRGVIKILEKIKENKIMMTKVQKKIFLNRR